MKKLKMNEKQFTGWLFIVLWFPFVLFVSDNSDVIIAQNKKLWT